MYKHNIETLIKHNFVPPQIYTYPPRREMQYQGLYHDINSLWYNNDMSDDLGVYFHIPFWKCKCIYCNLYAFEYDAPLIVDRYIDALCQHLKMHLGILKHSHIRSIHFGGGDPLLMETVHFERIIDILNTELPYLELSDIEFSVESTPMSVICAYEKNMIQDIIKLGVNRINIGAPPIIYNKRGEVRRLYEEKLTYKAIAILKKYNVRNISIDLMLGIENDTLEDWINTIKNISELLPDTVSYLPLTVRNDSIFGKDKNISLMTSNKYYQWYDAGVEILTDAGYCQQTSNRFVINTGGNYQEDSHFLLGSILGIGAGARSYNSVRDYAINLGYEGVSSIEKYIFAINEGRLMDFVYYSSQFSKEDLLRKKLILSYNGITKKEVFLIQNERLSNQIIQYLNWLVYHGFCCKNDNIYYFTKLGMKYHDLICLNFYSDGARAADPILWSSIEQIEGGISDD